MPGLPDIGRTAAGMGLRIADTSPAATELSGRASGPCRRRRRHASRLRALEGWPGLKRSRRLAIRPGRHRGNHDQQPKADAAHGVAGPARRFKIILSLNAAKVQDSPAFPVDSISQQARTSRVFCASVLYPPRRIGGFRLTSIPSEPRGRWRFQSHDRATAKCTPTLMKEPWAVPPLAAPLHSMRSDWCCRHTLRTTATAAAVVALQVTS